jgi:hypothetical protein
LRAPPLPPKTSKSLPPRGPIARDANTAVDLDIAKIDDRPTPRAGTMRPAAPPRPPRMPSVPKLPPLSARTTTLVFHGAPPVAPTTPPPTRPSHDEITPRVLLEDKSSRELVDAEPTTRLPSVAPRARTAPPPSQLPSLAPPEIDAFLSPTAGLRKRARVPAAVALAAAALVAQVSFARGVMSFRTEEPSRAVAFVAATPAPAAETRGDVRPAGCSLAVAPRVVAPRALVGAGIEASAAGGRVALAALVGPREARAVEIDPVSLAFVSTARIVVPSPQRRAVPLLAPGEPVDVVLDADARTRTTLDAAGVPFLVDARRGDAVRAVKLGDDVLVAVRRAGAIWLEHAGAPPLRLSGDAKQVGAPSMSARDGAVAIAWAERATPRSPWRVRWAFAGGDDPPRAMDLPAGLLGEQAMAPAVAVLDEDRVLLAWTEGPVSSHEVRAALLDATGAVAGAPLALSPPGANAGQPQIAIREDGRGVVGFFAAGAAKGTFALYAAAVSCP